MGRRDSSKTRVNPIFNHLLATDCSGSQWLDALFALGSREAVTALVPRGQRLVADHGRRWGEKEVALPAPRALLEFLVQNIDDDLVSASSSEGVSLEKRQALARKDTVTVEEALNKLRSGPRGREWYVLEGPSKPDALLETAHAILCIEGKRTEASCTTHTTWMRKRSQLVRHMDAALEAFPDKQVYGLLVVEGDGGANALAPSEYWSAQCEAQYEQSMLNASLPHRSPAERVRIADGILGVTTWQAVCAKLGPAWSWVPDAI